MIPSKRSQSQALSLTDMLLFPKKWREYKKQFRKKYSDPDEEAMRKQIYFSRYALIEENNKEYKEKIVRFKINPTELSDRTEDEIAAYYGNCDTDESGIARDDDKSWDMFKRRMKKTFHSESQEEIPKFFFLLKLKEINQYVNELKKIGIAVNLKDIDQYCDFVNGSASQTLVDDIESTQNRKRSIVDKVKKRKSSKFYETQ